MLLWLSETATWARGNHRPEAVAVIADVDPRTIRRFEKGEHWPQRLDEILSAYAFLSDIDDPRELWGRALDQWNKFGTAPALTGGDDQRRVAERIKERPARRETAAAPEEPAARDGALSGLAHEPEGPEQRQPAQKQKRNPRRGRPG